MRCRNNDSKAETSAIGTARETRIVVLQSRESLSSDGRITNARFAEQFVHSSTWVNIESTVRLARFAPNRRSTALSNPFLAHSPSATDLPQSVLRNVWVSSPRARGIELRAHPLGETTSRLDEPGQ